VLPAAGFYTAPEVRTTVRTAFLQHGAAGHTGGTMKPEAPLHVSQFRYYSPEASLRIRHRDLPHWEQQEVCAFLTFRAADSLPQPVLESWVKERREWLMQHGINTDAAENWRELLEELPEAERAVFHRCFTTRLHDLLDAGHGECLLRRADLRAVVEDSLRHWHGERCLLAGWVIMPNHLHAIVQPFPGHSFMDLGESWKRYTAVAINRMLGRTGHFWQGEGWDHLLRHAGYLAKYRRYLRRNPVRARLTDGEYSLWLPKIEGLLEE
jgi:putative transposase